MRTQGEVPSVGGAQGMSAHLGEHVGRMYGCMHTCSWVFPWAPPGGPSPRFPRVPTRGCFSAPLATAVPAHNDMVIASGGPATRTARLAGQPSPHLG